MTMTDRLIEHNLFDILYRQLHIAFMPLTDQNVFEQFIFFDRNQYFLDKLHLEI